MESGLLLSTSVTLLGRLRQEPFDQDAWADFVDRYGPAMLNWCRRWKLQDADAEDVTQNILCKLAQKLRTFQYDPEGSFRGWLRQVTQNALADFVHWKKTVVHGDGNEQVSRLLDNVEACADLVARLGQEFDLELFEEAICRVQLRVRPTTWMAFQLHEREGLSGAEAADRIGIPVAHVFVYSRRVLKLIKGEIRKLEDLARNMPRHDECLSSS